MTTEHFTQSLDRAAAEVRRSFVGCRRRDFWEWRLRPSETRQADDLRADLDQLLLQACQRPILTWGGSGQGAIQSRISDACAGPMISLWGIPHLFHWLPHKDITKTPAKSVSIDTP